MTDQHDPTATPSPVADGHDLIPYYEIRVQGRLTARWSAWFDGFAVTAHEDGTTVISGPVADHSALHGLLNRVLDIGLPLLSLTQLQHDQTTRPERN